MDESDAPHEEEPRPTGRWGPTQILVGLLAMLLILAGLVWAGAAVGILTGLVPGGLTFLEGWIGGTLGLVGLVLLYLLVRNINSP